jgi:hypothetical protein
VMSFEIWLYWSTWPIPNDDFHRDINSELIRCGNSVSPAKDLLIYQLN